MYTIWASFLNLIFPKICVTCEESLLKGEAQICTKCRYHLPYILAKDIYEDKLKEKFFGKVPIKHAFSFLKFQKSGKVQKIIHSLKYKNNQKIGEMLGQWFGEKLKTQGFKHSFDIILPVPLHVSKLKKRGYNQSDCIAKGLAKGLEIDWSNKVITRNKATDTQTNKTRLERFKNVDNIFEVKTSSDIHQKNILVVDDVITTGATLISCLNTLKKYQPKSLSIATLTMA